MIQKVFSMFVRFFRRLTDGAARAHLMPVETRNVPRGALSRQQPEPLSPAVQSIRGRTDDARSSLAVHRGGKNEDERRAAPGCVQFMFFKN